MRQINTQTTSIMDLVRYNKHVKLNIKTADTCFVSNGIGVLAYVFQKLVSLASYKVIKR
ncbi:MAG: hypothetical protein K0S71_1337 [Clostridia bacterium]|jgi:hypothetical protein|nr:hypothetical protein [Clostridia bacterium]